MVTRFLAGIGAAFTTVSVMTLAMKSVRFIKTTSIMVSVYSDNQKWVPILCLQSSCVLSLERFIAV